jgi:hypothetical protein
MDEADSKHPSPMATELPSVSGGEESTEQISSPTYPTPEEVSNWRLGVVLFCTWVSGSKIINREKRI